MGRDRWTIGAAFIMLGAIIATGGCMSSMDGLHQELRDARRAAYQQWQARHEPGQGESPRAGAAAQPRVDGELSLEDAVKLALVHNQALEATIEQREAARGQRVASRSGFLPRAAATAGYQRHDDVETIDFGLGVFELGALDNYAAGIEVRQPLSRGGASLARYRAAQLASLAAEEAIREAVQKTIHAVTVQYYDILLAHFLHEANAKAAESAREQLEVTRRRRAQGLASEFDVLRAQVELSNFRANKLRQANQIELGKARLFKTMGVAGESDIEPSDELVFEPLRPDLARAVRQAFEHRPDLYEADLNVRIEQQALRRVRAAYLPQVDALFRYEIGRPDPRVGLRDRRDDRWVAGVEARLNLFDGFQREGELIQQRAALRSAHLQRLDVQQEAVVEVREAILNLDSAEGVVDSQRLNVERAAEALRLAEVGLREGVNQPVEVTDARAALTRARSLYYEAIHEHTLARLALEKATGLLGPAAGHRPDDPAAVTPPLKFEALDIE